MRKSKDIKWKILLHKGLEVSVLSLVKFIWFMGISHHHHQSISFIERLIAQSNRIALFPDTNGIQDAKITNLVQSESLIKQMRYLLLIRFDAPNELNITWDEFIHKTWHLWDKSLTYLTEPRRLGIFLGLSCEFLFIWVEGWREKGE